MSSKKKTTWTKPRHRVFRNILAAILIPYTRLRYGVKAERFRDQGDRQFLIIMNHQTAFDQFFVAMSFKGPIYYIATEDLFSKGLISRIISFVQAPIPIKKQTMDLKAVKTCIRVAKEGGTIALAPEGNRTYSGRTVYMKPSIAKLCRSLKLPLAIYRIEGGYGVQPRWSDVVRKGTMTARVTRVIEPEEYDQMTNEELFDVIQKELWVDEAAVTGEYRHKNTAEYLERAIYVCPFCGLAEHESHGDTITCKSCGKQVKYLPTKELKGVDFDFPFPFVGQWYDYQEEYVNGLDLTAMTEDPLFHDTANLSEVILYDRKVKLKDNVFLTLYGNRLDLDGTVYPFEEISYVTVLGRNKLNLYIGDKVYQLKGSKRFNALKYVHIYHRYKNILEGNEDGKFLGL
ncbi:MAG: 1-acyl-sn-glycerol-3-phosphate acyltransferase [Ruminiclostridium sp.]|nr:1-acyl-sn-glycerol-3-phosphate acyltransferase [Ruminiclostridium sp.]